MFTISILLTVLTEDILKIVNSASHKLALQLFHIIAILLADNKKYLLEPLRVLKGIYLIFWTTKFKISRGLIMQKFLSPI